MLVAMVCSFSYLRARILHNLFLAGEGHLNQTQFWTIMNKGSISIFVHVKLETHLLWVHSQVRLVRCYVFLTLLYSQINFQSGCVDCHSHQQYISILVTPCVHCRFVLTVIFFFYNWYIIVVFNFCIFLIMCWARFHMLLAVILFFLLLSVITQKFLLVFSL